MKRCSKCKMEKDDSEFGRRSQKENYRLKSHCNECLRPERRRHASNWRSTNPNREREIRRAAYDRWIASPENKAKKGEYERAHRQQRSEAVYHRVARKKAEALPENERAAFIEAYIAYRRAKRMVGNPSVREQPANQQSQHS